MAISRGEVSSPSSTPSVSLGVPLVSRLRPARGRLSKARAEKGFPAQNKSTEHLFGRGRQSANPRIPGGLVSHEQGKRAMTASPRSGETAPLQLLDHHVGEGTLRMPAALLGRGL